MSDVLVKPAFQSAIADSGSPTQLGPNAWNAARLFTGGNAGELLIRDVASATGATWTADPTISGNALVTGPGSGAGLFASTPLVVRSGATGIDFVNTNYVSSNVHYRWQLHNSDSSGFFEFNYFTGGGTSVQTGWFMDPVNGQFTSIGGVITPNHVVRHSGTTVDLAYFAGRTDVEGGAVDDDIVLFAKGNLYLGGSNAWPARTLKITSVGLELISGYLQGTEQTAPSAPAANGYRIYAEDNGSGKTRLMCLFATGAAQQIAIQP